jgi:hypothetical protein
MTIALFVACAAVAYVGIAFFGQLVGGAKGSALQAFLATLSPAPLLVVTVANMFFGLALYYGFAVTRFAIPATIAIGVITSFAYSVAFLGGQISLIRMLGVAIVMVGIFLLSA